MDVIFVNNSQNAELDSYGMYLAEDNSAGFCDPVASCDTNFDN